MSAGVFPMRDFILSLSCQHQENLGFLLVKTFESIHKDKTSLNVLYFDRRERVYHVGL